MPYRPVSVKYHYNRILSMEFVNFKLKQSCRYFCVDTFYLETGNLLPRVNFNA